MTAGPAPVLFRSLVLGYLRTNRLRSLVTLIAIGLGVAICLAINLANAAAIASFASNVNVVASRVNLQVLGLGSGFDERTLLAVQRLPHVIQADPVIEDSIVVGAQAGDPFSGSWDSICCVPYRKAPRNEPNFRGPTYRAGAVRIHTN